MGKIVVIGPIADSLRNLRGNLLKEIVKNGHKVYVCAPGISADIRRQLEEIPAEPRDISFDRTGMNPFRDLLSIKTLIKLFKDIKPDAVLAYNIKPVIYGSIGARITKIPVMGSMICGLGYAFSGITLKSKLVNLLARFFYWISFRSNTAIFFQNPDDMSLFRKLGLIKEKDNAVLINGSGVDLTFYTPVPLPNRISFLLIGRLVNDKGIKEFVEAARIIKHKYPEIGFRLVGWIDDKPDAISRDEIALWAAEGVIEFLGKLHDVRPAIGESSVFVLPSTYREGTPRTSLEAMAMGRPVITTDLPGCRETVRHGINGFLIEPKNVPALATAMEIFIKKPNLIAEMGVASRKIAVEKFDERAVNRIILKNLNLLDEMSQ